MLVWSLIIKKNIIAEVVHCKLQIAFNVLILFESIQFKFRGVC